MNSCSTSWWSLLLINRPREDERLSWPCWLTYSGRFGVYPYKWLPISCRSDADQWKFAGQRPTFYHWATQPTKAWVPNWTSIFKYRAQNCTVEAQQVFVWCTIKRLSCLRKYSLDAACFGRDGINVLCPLKIIGYVNAKPSSLKLVTLSTVAPSRISGGGMSFVIGPMSISLVFLPLIFMAFNDDCCTISLIIMTAWNLP